LNLSRVGMDGADSWIHKDTIDGGGVTPCFLLVLAVAISFDQHNIEYLVRIGWQGLTDLEITIEIL
jgi:hypothetical protein